MNRYTKSSSLALTFLLSVSAYTPSYGTNDPQLNTAQEEEHTTSTQTNDLSVTDDATSTMSAQAYSPDAQSPESLANELSDEDETEIAQEMEDEYEDPTMLTDAKEYLERIAIRILLTGMDMQEFLAKKWNDFISPR